VTAVAYLPTLLVVQAWTADESSSLAAAALVVLGTLLAIVFNMLSQAVVLHGAFQHMRRRPVSLAESLKVGLARILPVVVLAIVEVMLIVLALLLFVIPGLIVFTMWSVAVPVCVVEQRGPIESLSRSSELTAGHRWKIFGLMLSLFVVSAVVSPLIDELLDAVAGTALMLIGSLVWNGIWGAFYAIAVVVTYHDLRVAKEGIDIEQIAAVFD
jgi:uncharacterized membrane protein